MRRMRPLFRDVQQEEPQFFCPWCGQEQYEWDRSGPVCAACLQHKIQQEEYVMTLQEMSTEYKANARLLHRRIWALQCERRQATNQSERTRLDRRLRALGLAWRESRQLAQYMEHYYERTMRDGEWSSAEEESLSCGYGDVSTDDSRDERTSAESTAPAFNSGIAR